VNVWVLTIEHRHGQETFVCKTEAVAWKTLANYVDEWWDQEIGLDVRRPKKDETAISRYFDKSNEQYELNEVTVLE
jgi:hypothetical protein